MNRKHHTKTFKDGFSKHARIGFKNIQVTNISNNLAKYNSTSISRTVNLNVPSAFKTCLPIGLYTLIYNHASIYFNNISSRDNSIHFLEISRDASTIFVLKWKGTIHHQFYQCVYSIKIRNEKLYLTKCPCQSALFRKKLVYCLMDICMKFS